MIWYGTRVPTNLADFQLTPGFDFSMDFTPKSPKGDFSISESTQISVSYIVFHP